MVLCEGMTHSVLAELEVSCEDEVSKAGVSDHRQSPARRVRGTGVIQEHHCAILRQETKRCFTSHTKNEQLKLGPCQYISVTELTGTRVPTIYQCVANNALITSLEMFRNWMWRIFVTI